MNDNTMPATEVEMVPGGVESAAYELAFHVLPTVAEGEVEKVFVALKEHITKAGGEIFDTEAPERFDLAYEIVKYLEGRNRRFGSAYFGWIRFRLSPRSLATITEEVEGEKQLLRYLMIRLTREEEQTPFRFHESIEKSPITTITDEDIVAELTPEGELAIEDVDVVDAAVVSGDDAVKSV